MTIHFKANLRPVVKDRVGMLHWITDPACSGFIIAYELEATHVLISNFDVRACSEALTGRRLIRDIAQKATPWYVDT